MKKYLLAASAAAAAMSMVVGLAAFAASGDQATADRLAAFATSQLSQVPASAKSNKIIKRVASSVKINVFAGAGEAQETYHVVITNFQLASAGVGGTTGATARAIFDSQADLNDLLNGKLEFVDALKKNKLKLKGIGLLNRLKVSLLVPAIKKLSK